MSNLRPRQEGARAIEMTACQDRAINEIMAAFPQRGEYLLTGYAGTGKTTLMREVALSLIDRHREVVVTAPTHKAVAILKSKVPDGVGCMTIHSLLGLKPCADGARTALKRGRTAKPITVDAVIIDECSMLSEELMRWIRKLLPHVFVLFVGDPAQIPPVGEKESTSFAVRPRSHLEKIVRQAEGNPILETAHAIRRGQGAEMDWSWCRETRAGKQGVFIPAAARSWMRQVFTSDRFKADNDEFRYLCWTNERVAEINAWIRRCIYGGETPTPFMPGERVLLRAPVLQDDNVILATNEEAEIVSIQASEYRHRFEEVGSLDAWSAGLPSWRMVLRSSDGLDVPVHMAMDADDVAAIDSRLLAEAKHNGARWEDRFKFKQSLAQVQAIYAMTIHTSQGSTFGHAFVDVGDIRRREKSNPLEMQQLLYVAATRPSQALILVGTGT